MSVSLADFGYVVIDKFFMNRKRAYIKQSLTYKRYSIAQALMDLKLIWKSFHNLNKSFIVKDFAKSKVQKKTKLNRKLG